MSITKAAARGIRTTTRTAKSAKTRSVAGTLKTTGAGRAGGTRAAQRSYSSSRKETFEKTAVNPKHLQVQTLTPPVVVKRIGARAMVHGVQDFRTLPNEADIRAIYEKNGVSAEVYDNLVGQLADKVDFMAYAHGHVDSGIDMHQFSAAEFKGYGVAAHTQIAKRLGALKEGEGIDITAYFPDAYVARKDKEGRIIPLEGITHVAGIYISAKGDVSVANHESIPVRSPFTDQLKKDQAAAEKAGEKVDKKDPRWKAEKYNATPNQLMTGSLGARTNTFRPSAVYDHYQANEGAMPPDIYPVDQSILVNGLPDLQFGTVPDFEAVRRHNDQAAQDAFAPSPVPRRYSPSADVQQQGVEQGLAAGTLTPEQAKAHASPRSKVEPDSANTNNNCAWTVLKAKQAGGAIAADLKLDRMVLGQSMQLLQKTGAAPNTPANMHTIHDKHNVIVAHPSSKPWDEVTPGEPAPPAIVEQTVANFVHLGKTWAGQRGQGYPADVMNMRRTQNISLTVVPPAATASTPKVVEDI